MAITLEAKIRVEPRREILHKAYNLLFNEKTKAQTLVLLQLHRGEACTWNELYEGSGLKDLRVSTSTVSRTLKELEEQGIIIREKAPFPVKVKYRLVKRFKELEDLVNFESMLKEAKGKEDFLRLVKETLREGVPLIFWDVSDAINKGDAETAVRHCFRLIHKLLLLAVNAPETQAPNPKPHVSHHSFT